MLLAWVAGCGETLATNDATLTAASTGVDASVVDAGVTTESCIVDRPMHVFTSSDDVWARLSGTWQMCTGAKIANSPRDAEGFRLTETGIRFLFPRADGGLRESDDWSAIGTFDVDGSGPWQVRFVVDFTTSTFDPQISEDGWVLDMDDASRGVRSTFVRVR